MNGLSDNELKDKVVQALKMVYDPEIPVDVYELGLIYEINIFPVNNVFILMTLTSPACPAAEMIPVPTCQAIGRRPVASRRKAPRARKQAPPRGQLFFRPSIGLGPQLLPREGQQAQARRTSVEHS